jgi:hypothetical protein
LDSCKSICENSLQSPHWIVSREGENLNQFEFYFLYFLEILSLQ